MNDSKPVEEPRNAVSYTLIVVYGVLCIVALLLFTRAYAN